MSKRCLGCMEEYGDQFQVCPFCGYVEGTPAREVYHLKPGTILQGQYLVGRVLGFGGFGITYIGFDLKLQHKIAIKEYLPGEFGTRMPNQTQVTVYPGEPSEQFREGLQKTVEEAQRLAKFQNVPGIVRVYNSFLENNTAYIIMEYLDGESLKERLEREKKMTVEESLPIILSILSSLEEVHKAGIIHRDIAPDNIKITSDGEVKLLDFGAARYATTKYSKSLSVIIKQGYAPVEQYTSRGDQGPWTDVYAMAATFYKMITGITPDDSMERKVKDNVKKPSKLGVRISKSVETALMNAMNVKIEERTQSAAEFASELMAAEVKEREVKKIREDVGKVPLWVKLVSGIGAALAAVFFGLLASGVIHFVAGTGTMKIPEGQTRVPNLINEEKEEAETKSKEAQLSLMISDKEYSDDIPADRIMNQDQDAGSLVACNTDIKVVISAGIQTVQVPDVTGYTRDEAVKKLEEVGFKAEFKDGGSTDPAATISGQDPAAGTEAKQGSAVQLSMAKEMQGGDASVMVTVPDLTGMNFDTASAQLSQQFITLSKSSEEFSDTIPAGVIMSQDTAAGQQLAQNSSISVVVSRGREVISVADIQYKTQEIASSTLQAQGLQVNVVMEASTTVEAGKVIRQDPAAKTELSRGDTVTIVISTGNPAAEKPAAEETAQETKAKKQTKAETAAPKKQTRAETPAPQKQEPQTAAPEKQAPKQTQAPQTKPATQGTTMNKDFNDI